MSFYTSKVKAILDIFISGVLLIVLSPLIIFVSMLLFVEDGINPFFLQERPGKYGKPFRIVKFRTMNWNRSANGDLLDDAQRITRFGKIIRHLSIDEIPQLFNVLLGSMSLIGPRPLLMQYLPLYNDIQFRRHELKPGITGWAQVNGRNTITWEDKFKYDLYYIDNSSFILDLRILYLTFFKVLSKEGVNQADNVTMEIFKGNDK